MISREYKKLRSRTKHTVAKEVRYRAEFTGDVEEFIYPSLRPKGESETPAHQPIDFADGDQDKDKKSVNDFSLNWKVDIEDLPVRLMEDGTPFTHLSDKGENTLRELLRKKYHERFSKEKILKAKGTSQMAQIARKQNLLNSMYGERKDGNETPDEVVSRLKNEVTADTCNLPWCAVVSCISCIVRCDACCDQISCLSSSLDVPILLRSYTVDFIFSLLSISPPQYYEMVCKGKAEGIGKAVQRSAVTTALERAYEEKSETLARVLPRSQTDAAVREHMSGLLYYQVKEKRGLLTARLTNRTMLRR